MNVTSILYAFGTIVAAGLIVWLLFWFIDWVALKEPFNKVAKVLVMALAIIVLINAILIVFGQRGFLRWGQAEQQQRLVLATQPAFTLWR